MAKIKKSVQVKVSDLTFHLSTLTFEQKSDAMAVAGSIRDPNLSEADRYRAMFKMQGDILRSALKKVDGLENEDGSPYQLKFEDGVLAHECLDDIMNLDINLQELFEVCGKLINPQQEQEALQGVEVEQPKKGNSKK